LGRETKRAWKEGVEASRAKYGPPPPAADGPNDTKNCPQQVVVDGEICPRCLTQRNECRRRNRVVLAVPPAGGRPTPGPFDPLLCQRCSDDEGQRKAARRASTAAANPPTTNNNVVPIRPRENTVTTIQTATGGEITNAEQFLAEARAIASEAAAEMEDAAADAARAEADMSRIETMVASLTSIEALSSDIAAVAALKDPAAQRAQAARDRVAAADQRLAGAKAVEGIAARHVQLIGVAAGSFYNAA
jgi:hypothetical protein